MARKKKKNIKEVPAEETESLHAAVVLKTKPEVVFETKPVHYFGRTVPILMQSVDGSCPIIAICNVLLLRGDIKLSQDTKEVTLNVLINLVEEWHSDPSRETNGFFLKKTRQDILQILESFANSVYLDIGFLSIHDFKLTLEIAIFKALNIELVHGWLFEDAATKKTVGYSSYDDLHDRLVAFKAAMPTSSGSEERSGAGDIAAHESEEQREEKAISEFVSGKQLTTKGLFSLHEGLQEKKLCVLYWNLHFSTLVKYNKELYMLVTSISYKEEPNHVWQKLCDV